MKSASESFSKATSSDSSLLSTAQNRVQQLHSEQIRVVLQALDSWGYADIAAQLSHNSGVQANSPSAEKFRKHVLSTHWDDAIDMLDSIPFTDNKQRMIAKVLLLRRKYINSILTAPNTALDILRNELTPITSKQHLHQLSMLLLARNSAEVWAKSRHVGVKNDSPFDCLTELSSVVPSEWLLPEHRFDSICSRSLAYELLTCPFHCSTTPLSLLGEHKCRPIEVPSIEVGGVRIEGEAWSVRFCDGGKFLVVFGTNGFDLFSIDTMTSPQDFQRLSNPKHHSFPEPINDLDFSMNSQVIGVISNNVLRVVNVSNGFYLFESNLSDFGLADGEGFFRSLKFFSFNNKVYFVVSLVYNKEIADEDSFLVLFQVLSGATVVQLAKFKFLPVNHLITINDVLVAVADVPGERGSRLIGVKNSSIFESICKNTELEFFSFVNIENQIISLDSFKFGTTVNIFLATGHNSTCQILTLIDFDKIKSSRPFNVSNFPPFEEKPLCNDLSSPVAYSITLKGHKSGKFQIEAGIFKVSDNEVFISIGSEDGRVPVWRFNSNKRSPNVLKPVSFIRGNTQLVNSVAFCPLFHDNCVLATAADDGQVMFFVGKEDSKREAFADLV
ncbi:hypothetical protein P9112_009739 [Eukaryota sp. TZLM1-RC]